MRDTEKVLKQLEKFIKDKKIDSDEEYEAAVQEFMKLHNLGTPIVEETLETRSDYLFEQALEADNEKDALKLVHEALRENPNNCDAKIFLAEIAANNGEVLEEDIIRIIKEEQARLVKEDIYKEENFGYFYDIVETRSYIRAKVSLIEIYLSKGRYQLARHEMEEVLKLNDHDNMGVRYRLLSIYCFLEKKDKINALLDKYPEGSLLTWLPLSVYYYKTKNYFLLDETLNKMYEYNKNILKVIHGAAEANSFDMLENSFGAYQPGDMNEAMMVVEGNLYLIAATTGYIIYLTNWKPSIKNKVS